MAIVAAIIGWLCVLFAIAHIVHAMHASVFRDNAGSVADGVIALFFLVAAKTLLGV